LTSSCPAFHVSISALISRPAPPSTPFPYTTLFRSLAEFRRPCRHATRRARQCEGLRHQRDVAAVVAGDLLRHAEVLDLRVLEHLDRKSTRLNSSHSQISYAVFCLKKKKNKSTQ